jgi:hypothetical protein
MKELHKEQRRIYVIPSAIFILVLLSSCTAGRIETNNEYLFPEYKSTSTKWFQNFESYPINYAYPSGSQCTSTVLINSHDLTNDLGPATDTRILKQDPTSGSGIANDNRAANITSISGHSVNASKYTFLIFYTFLSKPFSQLQPAQQAQGGDNFYIRIYDKNGPWEIWSTAASCGEGSGACQQWSKMYVNLDSDPLDYTGTKIPAPTKIDKTSITKVIVLEWDPYYLLLDNFYFAKNQWDGPPAD